MRIKQLGNGGGLNPQQTNSSFLIELEKDKYLLFDCGFNIMSRLIEEENNDTNFKIENIKYVFISHTHDDHIGNLETLIYWNYFKNNKTMTVLYASEEVEIAVSKIKQNLYSGGRVVYTPLYKTNKLTYNTKLTKECTLHAVEGYNGPCISHGALISDKTNQIFISGDTKATSSIEERLSYYDFNLTSESSILFHDFSSWNAPSKNIHACESDFTIEYSEEFQKKAIKYHTGDDNFFKDWREL